MANKKTSTTKSAPVKAEVAEKTTDKAAAVTPEVKEEPAKKEETPKAEKTEQKPAEKKETASVEKEEAAPVEEKETKPAAKKPGRKPGKTVAKKKSVEKIEEVHVQYQELAITTQEVVDKVKQIYVSHGHRESSIKTLRLYIKPEERKAYYVINDKIMDSVDL